LSEKIALFSPFFYPEIISTGKYNTYLVMALQRLGYSIDVVASYPLYPDWKPRKTSSSLENVNIFRGGLFPYPKAMVLRRFQLELGFMFHCIRYMLSKNRGDGDIIIPVFPPMLFFLAIFALLPTKANKIGIVHDVQGIMANVANSLMKSGLLAFIRYFEKKVFHKCDKLIFVSKSMAEKAITDYDLKPDKVVACYPFVNIDKSILTDDLAPLFPAEKKHIVYSGALGEKQNPFELLKLFQSFVQTRDDTICHIFSRGPLVDELKEINHVNTDRIRFHDLVPEKNLYELYLRSDIQIIPQKPGTSEGSIPSKLPNILASGVPTFLIGDSHSDLANLVKKSGIGYCAETWQSDILVTQLNAFLESSQQHNHNVRQNMVSDFVKDNFGIDQLIKMIVP